jgi:hypothetical protein
VDNVFALIFSYFAAPLRYQAGTVGADGIQTFSHLAEPPMPPPESNARRLLTNRFATSLLLYGYNR